MYIYFILESIDFNFLVTFPYKTIVELPNNAAIYIHTVNALLGVAYK